MTDHIPRRPFDWPFLILRLVVLVAAAAFVILCFMADRAYGGITHATFDTTRTVWTTSTADTADTRATFLSESEPFTPKNSDPSEVYVAHPASSAEQRVGIVGWVESLPDSITGAVESATLTLYRLNNVDAAGVNDSLEIAPVTVSWTEAQTSWLNRRLGRPWSTAGGDVDTSYATRVRAGDVTNLASGGANAAVSFDIKPIVEAWVAEDVAFNGVRVAWLSGSSPEIRFQDNAAGAPYRPQISVQSYTVQTRRQLGLGMGSDEGLQHPGGRRLGW